jgi:hypothetical protein
MRIFKSKHKLAAICLTGLVGVIFLLIVTYITLPRLANHYGFALPGSNGLPYRISYDNRTYSTQATCAGANWCESNSEHCVTQANLVKKNYWPLAEISTIPTLFGSDHKVMVAEASKVGKLPMVLYIAKKEGCYISYGLEGGP